MAAAAHILYGDREIQPEPSVSIEIKKGVDNKYCIPLYSTCSKHMKWVR